MFAISLLGKTLILFGVIFVILGVVLMLGGKLPWFGKLPGDILIQKKNFSFYFPITTSILISVILSAVMILLRRK